MSRLRRGMGLTALSLALVGLAQPAAADVIAEETFSYAPGATVNGQSGGTGWSGAWITGQPSGFTSAAAIAGGPSIGATGGSMQVSASGRIFRLIDTGPGSAAVAAGIVQAHTAMFFGSLAGIGAPGTTVWVGVLVSGGTGNAGDETQYHLYEGARTDAASLAMGDSNKDGEVIAMLRGGSVADWGFERTCNHSACGGAAADGYFATSPAVPFGGTHWSVTRYVFHATTTDITVWRDPTPGATAPADTAALLLTPFSGGTAVYTTTVPALHFNTVAPNASGNFNYFVDEIRITTTFAELSGGMVSMLDAGTGSVDAATSIDAAIVGVDAATSIDAAVVGIDAASTTDSGVPPVDSGATSDAATAVDAGSTATDGSVARDGATTPPPQAASCGCSAAGAGPRSPWALLLLAALVLRRKRRR